MELVFFLKIFSYLILFFIILLGIAKVISIFINYLPKLHSELFALRSKLVKKNINIGFMHMNVLIKHLQFLEKDILS